MCTHSGQRTLFATAVATQLCGTAREQAECLATAASGFPENGKQYRHPTGFLGSFGHRLHFRAVLASAPGKALAARHAPRMAHLRPCPGADEESGDANSSRNPRGKVSRSVPALAFSMRSAGEYRPTSTLPCRSPSAAEVDRKQEKAASLRQQPGAAPNAVDAAEGVLDHEAEGEGGAEALARIAEALA
jgi:hypothetical protein